MSEEEFEPIVIAFCCNWCSYAGADLAGTSRLQYPPNVRIVRVMCSGMVHPTFVVEAFMAGADGVVMCGCHPGDCHYLDGNTRAAARAETSGWSPSGSGWNGSQRPRVRSSPW